MVNRTERDSNIDILRGLLIFLVVLGHSKADILHEIIFLFHMPLFFILSGYFLQKEKLLAKRYLTNKAITLLIPYSIYLLLDLLLIRRDYSTGSLVRIVYGGRSISGVYWYITCFLFALVIFSFYQKYFSDIVAKCLILSGGVIAILESHLVEKIRFLQYPGIPWNLDASLIALVYIGIGFFYKKQFRNLLEEDLIKYDICAGVVSFVLIALCWLIYKDGNRMYYFDMKPVYYKELVSAILIPCAFGLVIVRVVHWGIKIKLLYVLNDFFALCGRATIPIMFMHMPLNYWKDSLGYGRIVYLIIAIVISIKK